jgi:Flp pilus assembly protein TadD
VAWIASLHQISEAMELEGTQPLRQEIERTLRRAFDPADVLPRLARLARMAPAASEDALFAHRQLAELLVERHPWRAALHARRALAQGDDDRCWAVLAFCQTLLGNFHCAVTAYKRAIACAPSNPWYAHNLGHLLDVGLGEPGRALPFLRSAHLAKPESSEMTASFAHALARSGRSDEARGVLDDGLARHASKELAALRRWLDHGAPSRRRGEPRGEGATDARRPRAMDETRRSAGLSRALTRGLANLPLDARQRSRAMALARDIAAVTPGAPFPVDIETGETGETGETREAPRGREGARAQRREELASLAAAVAYAIVYVDHVPLSQAEVAAPFRVAVARLRERFAELRAKLDLIPGDVRYATARR